MFHYGDMIQIGDRVYRAVVPPYRGQCAHCAGEVNFEGGHHELCDLENCSTSITCDDIIWKEVE
jgi:hypothetical protein